MSTPEITDLRRKPVFWQFDGPPWTREIWPRLESFNWFIKSHRDQLIQNGAICRIGREYFIDQRRFPNEAQVILGLRKAESIQTGEVAA